jgi:hypothetical protein
MRFSGSGPTATNRGFPFLHIRLECACSAVRWTPFSLAGSTTLFKRSNRNFAEHATSVFFVNASYGYELGFAGRLIAAEAAPTKSKQRSAVLLDLDFVGGVAYGIRQLLLGLLYLGIPASPACRDTGTSLCGGFSCDALRDVAEADGLVAASTAPTRAPPSS